MGIRVAHDPVAMPMIAAYAGGVGKAQERKKNQAVGILMEQDKMNRMQQERMADRVFQHGENEANRTAMAERDKARNSITLPDGTTVDRDIFNNQQDWARQDAQNQQYRDKDELGELYGAIEMREKYMLNTPLNEQGQRQRDEAARSLEWIRRQRDSVRPDAYRQYLGQWVSEFDRRNPQSWEAPPKVQMDGYEYLDREGRPMSHEDAISGRVPIGTMIPPGRNGVPGRPYEVPRPQGFASTPEEYFSDPKNFNDAYKAANEALKDPDTDAYPTDQEKIKAEMRKRYELQRSMAAPAAGGAAMPPPAGAPGTAPPVQGAPANIGPADPNMLQQGRGAATQYTRTADGQLVPTSRQWTPPPVAPQAAPAQPQQAPLNAGDPYQQAVQQQFSDRADPQYANRMRQAENTVREYKYMYQNIQSLDEIKNPDDRRELEEALKVLGMPGAGK